jgi:hypothetical protein
MFSSLTDPIKIGLSIVIGLMIGAALTSCGMFFSYEGLRLPIFGQVINGRVADAVQSATGSMVTKFERDALQAQLDKEKRDRLAAEQTAAKAKKRADATEVAKQEADARIKLLQAAAKTDNMPIWSKEELEWYEKH